MRRASNPLIALLCATAAGCAVGPNYAHPSAPISPAFKEAAGWSPAAPADALDRGDWWALFGESCSERAGGQGAGLQSRISSPPRPPIARPVRSVSEQRAALFPTVATSRAAAPRASGAGGLQCRTRRGEPMERPLAAPSGSRPGRQLSREPGRQLGDRRLRPHPPRNRERQGQRPGQRRRPRRRRATGGPRRAGHSTITGLHQARVDVELCARSSATVAGYQRTVQITQNRFNAGTVPHSDLLQAQTQLYNAQADLAAIRQQRDTYEHAIAVLAGEAPGNFTLATAQIGRQRARNPDGSASGPAPASPRHRCGGTPDGRGQRPDRGRDRRLFPDAEPERILRNWSQHRRLAVQRVQRGLELWRRGRRDAVRRRPAPCAGQGRAGRLRPDRRAVSPDRADGVAGDVENQLIATQVQATTYGLRQQASDRGGYRPSRWSTTSTGRAK